MALAYWLDDPSAWNNPILGDITLPGICVVTAEKGRDVDRKKAKGQDGYTIHDNGMGPGSVTIVMTLPNRAAWLAWQKIRPTIDPNRAGKIRAPLGIQHPQAADRGIDNVYVKNVKCSPPTARGGMVVTIECEEWFPAPKKTKAASKAKPAQKRSTDETPSIISNLNETTPEGQEFVKNLTFTNF